MFFVVILIKVILDCLRTKTEYFNSVCVCVCVCVCVLGERKKEREGRQEREEREERENKLERETEKELSLPV